MFNFASLTDIVAMFLAWSLGLYVVTRNPRRPLSLVAAGSTFGTALFLFGSAMLANLRDLGEYKAWGGTLWWAGAVAIALWYWTSVLVIRRERASVPEIYVRYVAYPLGAVLAAAAIALGAAARATDAVLVWSDPQPLEASLTSSSWNVSPGSLFPWVVAYVLVGMAVPLLHLAIAWRRAPREAGSRPQLRWLTGSAVLLMFGTLWVAIDAATTDNSLPRVFGFIDPGIVVVAVGLVILAWSVVQHGAWMERRPVRGDFRYFITGQAIVVAIYAGVVVGFGLQLNMRSLAMFFTLGLLAMAGHALADLGRVLLGRLFFPDAWEAQRRFLQYALDSVRATDHADVLRRAADETDEQWWYEQTERALRRLRNPHGLAQQDLIASLTPDDATPLDRARLLSDLIAESIQKLAPDDDRTPPRPYVILHESYVEGRATKQIMAKHQIPEKTYYTERKRGVAAIAVELRAQARA